MCSIFIDANWCYAMSVVAQAACICENRGSIYSYNYLRSRAAWLPSARHSNFNNINVIPIDYIPYLPRIRNKEYNYIYITYSIFLIWSNLFFSLFAPNKKQWIEFVFYSLLPTPYMIEAILFLLFLIWKEYGIRNGVSFLFHIPYFIKIDVTLDRQLRKLHVSTGTAASFTRITDN